MQHFPGPPWMKKGIHRKFDKQPDAMGNLPHVSFPLLTGQLQIFGYFIADFSQEPIIQNERPGEGRIPQQFLKALGFDFLPHIHPVSFH